MTLGTESFQLLRVRYTKKNIESLIRNFKNIESLIIEIGNIESLIRNMKNIERLTRNIKHIESRNRNIKNIESLIRRAHSQKNHETLTTVRCVGGANAYGQSDRKYPCIFYALP